MQSVGTFFGLSIGATALSASMVGEEVVGNNIANASTPGYSDESTVFTEGDPVNTGVGSLGSGVIASSIQRASDQYLTAQTLNANSNESSYNAQVSWLTNAQDAFNEPGTTTINTQLTTFFDNFQTLESDPTNSGALATAVGGGQTVAQMMNTASSSLSSVSTQISQAITSDQSSLNSYGQQIAALNQQISNLTAEGESPNTLLDERDDIISSASSLANVNVTQNADGSVNVDIGSTSLVSGMTSNTVTVAGLLSNNDLQSGELAGLTQAQTQVGSYQTDLNNLASSLISQVNAVSEAGTAADGTTGTAFFTGTDASDIAVNQTLINNPEELPVAAATTPAGTPPAPGDATTATAIANLGSATLGASAGALSGQTFEGYYNTSVTSLASALNTATSSQTAATATSTQLSNQLASETGVNEDDETTNMLEYQKMYEAAAQLISTQNTMLQSLMTMIPAGE